VVGYCLDLFSASPQSKEPIRSGEEHQAITSLDRTNGVGEFSNLREFAMMDHSKRMKLAQVPITNNFIKL
jgi:hypothetical protein